MSSSTQQHESPLNAYASYPFDSDEIYQQGLASILAANNDSEDIRAEIIRKTRVFYFNKITGYSITVDEARDVENGVIELPRVNDDETRVLSFEELKELIESGNVDKIPNNKFIPDKLHDAMPTQSTAIPRKKPWENVDTTSES